jgi:deoxycytidine triphosphate deaminase
MKDLPPPEPLRIRLLKQVVRAIDGIRSLADKRLAKYSNALPSITDSPQLSDSRPSNTIAPVPNSRYAETSEEAARRYKLFESIDPFPEIEAALLNSADISDYVAATGMICPFHEDKQKPASYEIRLLGKYVFWDDKGKKQVGEIRQGEEFILRENSIAFVTLEPEFRLPEYIALRFNLKITHIYRGILLGTGPLVDPGFVGKLSVPLHNLTTNDYTFTGGDPLIWMEFTKLSRRREWQERPSSLPTIERQGKFYEFPEEKKSFGDVESYLRKADPHRPIRSSIPDALEGARHAAEQAERKVNYFTIAGLLSILGLLVAFGYGSYQTLSLVNDTTSYVGDARNELNELKEKIKQQDSALNTEREKVQTLTKQVEELRKQMEKTPLPPTER